MVFLVRFVKTRTGEFFKDTYIFEVFQRPHISLVLRSCTILIVFKKLTRVRFFPNCTRNHAITLYK